MNPVTHRIELETSSTPQDAKRLEVGEIVEVKGWKYRIKSVDVAKQQIVLKLLPGESEIHETKHR